ncbi:MAG: hypothetical protein A2519_08390 [Candidatus Raymondbacteria bacterium RIFOXYD12_FULL_49_13]|uniref:Uncharacterized protein n=1 Tax=Candidatus Raymondbacteria bacterium RIFOXYD12_FULL_49_13 TaxID=1817890 RepID=A0A1F7FI34_UNCRA|nr:MAG: hypothetical protein A2519_08390 [Candidatus Raymondbacteria bacterium RIFOXYD12_FULL_49_13]
MFWDVRKIREPLRGRRERRGPPFRRGKHHVRSVRHRRTPLAVGIWDPRAGRAWPASFRGEVNNKARRTRGESASGGWGEREPLFSEARHAVAPFESWLPLCGIDMAPLPNQGVQRKGNAKGKSKNIRSDGSRRLATPYDSERM